MTDTLEAPAAAPAKPKRVKPATVDLLTAHCRNLHHTNCRGSGPNGSDSTWYCNCDCHVEQPTCRDCGQRGGEVTLEGTCIDVEGCTTTQSVRTASNPVHQQLRSIIADAEQREAKVAARKASERAIRREQEAAQAQAEGRPVVVRAPRVKREAPTPQCCHCGCGGMTKGGKFVAGHDAKLKGILVRAARQTPPDNGSKPAVRSDAIRAMAELIARDWPRKGVSPAIARQADELFNQYGVSLIDKAVARRYGDK